MPKTLFLEYPENFGVVIDGQPAFLPKVLHTRPSASTCLLATYDEGRLSRAVFSSAYDALTDIVLEMDVMGDVGLVKSVSFEESK